MQIDWKGITFDIDDVRGGQAYFVLGVRKSGSSMFNRVMRLLAKYNDYNFVDVAGSLFSKNIKVGEWVRDPSFNTIIFGGNVYGGFRNFPSAIRDNPLYVEGKKVLLVRDPRDALTSEYFSNAYSHSLPQAAGSGGARADLLAQRQIALATPIDEYVSKRARMMGRTMAEFEPLLGDPNALVLKYEDIIFEKRKMIVDVLDHFGWTCSDSKIDAILGWVDVRPEQEIPQQFIRRVTPGDHAEKLQPETIEALNKELANVLAIFRYRIA